MRVFVYGTLLRGQGNHHLLKTARYEGQARTRAAYRMHSLGGFPGVVAVTDGPEAIEGEVYFVDAATLARLDRLEGHPRFYRRTVIALADGTRATTYLLPNRSVAGCPVIPGGSWLKREKEAIPWLQS